MAYNKQTEMYEGYIYCISNTINDKKYIGQTTVTVQHRWGNHQLSARNRENYPLYNAMNKYGIDNFSIQELHKVECDTKEALIRILNELEQDYIKKFDTYNHGYNLTTGGRDNLEHQYKSVRQYNLDGTYLQEFDSVDSLKMHLNKECVSSIYSCCHGEIKYAYGYIWRFSEDSIDKYPLPNEDEICEANIRVKSNEKVKQYSLTGELLCIYTNASMASELTGVKRIQIVKSCSGARISGGGFIWRFEGDEFDTNKSLNEKSKLVFQYDQQLNLINTYASTRLAAKTTGINRNSIGAACRGTQHTAGGFIWSYNKH